MTSEISTDKLQAPDEYALFDIFPIQSLSVTLIGCSLPRESRVSITIFDMSGPTVFTILTQKIQPASYYSRFWDHREIADLDIIGRPFLLRIEADATDGSEHFMKEQEFSIIPQSN